MKFEVIGWTYDTDRRFPDHRGDSGAVLRAIVNALRAGGYKFGGNTHQDGATGTPVLNDGTKMCYSWRGWGGVMAKALDLPDRNGMAYMAWYMDTLEAMMGEKRREIVMPPWGVDEKRIRKRDELAETFEMHLCPEAFEAVSSGKKTVELRLNDEKRTCLCRGDFIEFICGERRCRVRVTRTEYFDDFDELFGERETHEDEKFFAHRRSLVRRARFGGCKTPQALLGFLLSVYSEEERKKNYALAISFRLAEDPCEGKAH